MSQLIRQPNQNLLSVRLNRIIHSADEPQPNKFYQRMTNSNESTATSISPFAAFLFVGVFSLSFLRYLRVKICARHIGAAAGCEVLFIRVFRTTIRQLLVFSARFSCNHQRNPLPFNRLGRIICGQNDGCHLPGNKNDSASKSFCLFNAVLVAALPR